MRSPSSRPKSAPRVDLETIPSSTITSLQTSTISQSLSTLENLTILSIIIISYTVSEQPIMVNLLALPNEVLLHIAINLPPSKILRLRLVNKHLCAAIEKAFNGLCLAEVTFPLTSSGLRSLVRFSRSSLAAHVKVLLLKVDGVYTHLQIKSVRNQIYLSDALALLRTRHASLSVGVKYDPKGTVIGELRNPVVEMAVMTNIKHVFTKFLLPTVAASGITISTLYFDVQSESLHDEGLRASNPMITWLHVSCVASAAVTWDMLLRYQHSKDNTTPSNYIHFARGATLTINSYTSACYTDTLPFLITNDYSTLVIDNGKIPQPGDRFLGGPYAMPTTSLHITSLELVGPHADHCTCILNLQKRNINNNHVAVSCQIRMLSRCRNHNVQEVITGGFTTINGSGIQAGVKKVLGSAHHRSRRPLKYSPRMR
ncbi:hypothetical protein KCU77_g1866, partial [Aureobasidium melanogenum]